MNFHSPEAANIAAWREKAEYLEEENKLLKAALTAETPLARALQRKLNLTLSESKIVDLLLEAKGEPVSRGRIGNRLYGLDCVPKGGNGEAGTVNVFLTKIRHKLRQFNSTLEIETHWNCGWLIAPHHRSLILAHVGATTTMAHPPSNSN